MKSIPRIGMKTLYMVRSELEIKPLLFKSRKMAQKYIDKRYDQIVGEHVRKVEDKFQKRISYIKKHRHSTVKHLAKELEEDLQCITDKTPALEIVEIHLVTTLGEAFV